jgi:hypothetical protein
LAVLSLLILILGGMGYNQEGGGNDE